MKLDKIFIDPMPNPSDGYVGIAWLDAHSEAVEYIRKDTLLEWAKEHKMAIEVNGDEDDSYTRGEYDVINSLIDKLNSL